jgi:DNA polymerase III gamma/tau subunit
MIFTPYSESVQVALIFNADKLTEEAQNSFLKTLEESSNNTAYILTTSNEKNLLPTIISRSLKVYTKDRSVQNNSKEIPDTLTKNLIDAFKDIEKIAKDKDSTDNFLNEVELYYQALLKQNLKDKEQLKQIYDNIQCIEKTRRRIMRMATKDSFENLFLVLRGHSSSYILSKIY